MESDILVSLIEIISTLPLPVTVRTDSLDVKDLSSAGIPSPTSAPSFVRQMRIVPFRLDDIVRLAAISAGPLLPLTG